MEVHPMDDLEEEDDDDGDEEDFKMIIKSQDEDNFSGCQKAIGRS